MRTILFRWTAISRWKITGAGEKHFCKGASGQPEETPRHRDLRFRGFAEAYAGRKNLKNAKGGKTFQAVIPSPLTGRRWICVMWSRWRIFEQTSALAYFDPLRSGAAGRRTKDSAAACGGIAKADGDKGLGQSDGLLCALRAGKAENSGDFCGIGSLPGIRMQAPILPGGCVRREWGIVRLSAVAGNKSDSAGSYVSCGQKDHMNTEKKQSDL